RFFDEAGDMHMVLHAPFGSRVNKAWGLALRKRFCQTFNFELQAAATEDAILLSLGPTHSFPLADAFRFLHSSPVRHVLVQARRFLSPEDASQLGALDREAIAQVLDEAWPRAETPDELHDALNQIGFLTAEEGGRAGWAPLLAELKRQRRATELTVERGGE